MLSDAGTDCVIVGKTTLDTPLIGAVIYLDYVIVSQVRPDQAYEDLVYQEVVVFG